MNTAKLIAWLVLPLLALVVVGVLAVSLFKALLGGVFYLLLGAAVVGGGYYLYQRAKRSVGPGTRARRRIEAANETYRMRNH